jgi:hypothetical protein
MPTGLSVIQFRDLYRADWALDWDGVGTAFKAALFGAKTIDFSAALAYNTTPLNTGEQAGSGYTAGGMAVPSRTVSETGTGTGIVSLNATFMEWNPITTTSVRNFVIYKVADNKVVGIWDLGTPTDLVTGIFRVTFTADRVVTQKVV